jgi:hypothetical protein
MRDRATQAIFGFRLHNDANVVGHQTIGLLILAVTTPFARRLEIRSGPASAKNII